MDVCSAAMKSIASTLSKVINRETPVTMLQSRHRRGEQTSRWEHQSGKAALHTII